MLRRLQITLMASLATISFLSTMFSTMPARAQSGASPGARVGAITPTTDESGRKIYVNEDAPPAGSRARASTPSPSRLVYWSSTEHRFKPVPTSGAVMRAARSAASEVNNYLDGRAQSHPTLNRAFTQQDIDAAIDAAAARHHVDPSLVRSALNVANPFDPAQNVDAGVRHLRKLLDSYGGNVRLSLAAYNAGAGAVARSAGVPHFRETQDYVRKITNLYNGG